MWGIYLKFTLLTKYNLFFILRQAVFGQERLRRYPELFCAQMFLKFYVKNVTYKNLDSITLPQLYRYIFSIYNLALTYW